MKTRRKLQIEAGITSTGIEGDEEAARGENMELYKPWEKKVINSLNNL